eukprot:GHVP01030622.1.p1 GENE.GHVP01030622.1~~GHVP01030622.1.p1  ORF type:complete len:1094 (-),score=222.79 GHVP01030622.1:759-3626(-)
MPPTKEHFEKIERILDRRINNLACRTEVKRNKIDNIPVPKFGSFLAGQSDSPLHLSPLQSGVGSKSPIAPIPPPPPGEFSSLQLLGSPRNSPRERSPASSIPPPPGSPRCELSPRLGPIPISPRSGPIPSSPRSGLIPSSPTFAPPQPPQFPSHISVSRPTAAPAVEIKGSEKKESDACEVYSLRRMCEIYQQMSRKNLIYIGLRFDTTIVTKEYPIPSGRMSQHSRRGGKNEPRELYRDNRGPDVRFKSDQPSLMRISHKSKSLEQSSLATRAELDTMAEARTTLNKLAVENFETLAKKLDQLMNKKLNTLEQLQNFVAQIIETAVEQIDASDLYSDLCVVLCAVSPKYDQKFWSGKYGEEKTDFKRELLKKSQETFEKIKTQTTLMLSQELKDTLSEEDQEIELVKRKSRTLGTMRFLGQLIFRQVISVAILVLIVEDLLKDARPEEHHVNCIVEVYATVGEFLKGRSMKPENKKKMEATFDKLEGIMNDSTYSQKTRFMIMNLMDLRNKGWKKSLAEVASTREKIKEGSNVKETSIQGRRRAQPYDDYFDEHAKMFEKKKREDKPTKQLMPTFKIQEEPESSEIELRITPSPSMETPQKTPDVVEVKEPKKTVTWAVKKSEGIRMAIEYFFDDEDDISMIKDIENLSLVGEDLEEATLEIMHWMFNSGSAKEKMKISKALGILCGQNHLPVICAVMFLCSNEASDKFDEVAEEFPLYYKSYASLLAEILARSYVMDALAEPTGLSPIMAAISCIKIPKGQSMKVSVEVVRQLDTLEELNDVFTEKTERSLLTSHAKVAFAVAMKRILGTKTVIEYLSDICSELKMELSGFEYFAAKFSEILLSEDDVSDETDNFGESLETEIWTGLLYAILITTLSELLNQEPRKFTCSCSPRDLCRLVQRDSLLACLSKTKKHVRCCDKLKVKSVNNSMGTQYFRNQIEVLNNWIEENDWK